MILAPVLSLQAVRGRSRPFDPTTIASFLFGYDADRIGGADNSAVATWPDMALTPHNATQSTAANRPLLSYRQINGRRAVVFDGVDDLLQTTGFTRAMPETIYAVFRFATTAGNKTVYESQSIPNVKRLLQAQGAFSDNLVAYNGTGNIQASSVYMNGSWQVVKMIWNGPSSSMTLNNIATIAADAGSSSANGLSIGNSPASDSPMNGGISLLWGFADVIADGSATDRQIWSYLNSRARITQMFYVGDSQTSGYGATSNDPWPTQFQALIPTALHSTNVAVSATTAADMIASVPSDVVAHFKRCARNIVIVMAGTNDIYFGADASATYSRLVTLHGLLRAAGFRTVAMTPPPRSDTGTPVDYETTRQSVSAMMRANGNTSWDAMWDLALDPDLGPAGSENNLALFQAGGVHRNFAGDTIVATKLAGVVNTQLP